MMWIIGKTNSQNSVRKKGFGGTFCILNCHIIGLDTGVCLFETLSPRGFRVDSVFES
jgi:hypothetical protein